MRYRALLVDDEPLALQRLQKLLGKHADTVEIVGTAEDGPAAIEQIARLRPDLVFLDIQMPELNGFEVLGRLDYMPLVIFSTAYDEYALKAFEVNSIDYLLKPVDPRRLEVAIEKLVRLSDAGLGDLRERIERTLEKFDRSRMSRIQVRSGDRIKFIPVSEVVFLRASDKYVELHSYSNVQLLSHSLSKLEAGLPEEDFVRIHRSIIVNVNFIEEIVRDASGIHRVRVKDAQKTQLPVSRRYRSRLDLI